MKFLLYSFLLFSLNGCVSDAVSTAVSEKGVVSQPNYRHLDTISDPIEPVNKAIFSFNQLTDTYLVFPLSDLHDTLPFPIAPLLGNVAQYLSLPNTFMNQLLQGEVSRSLDTLSRFVVNTTVGLLGTVDIATMYKIPLHYEDFGQTLAIWGVPTGPYVVIPLFMGLYARDVAGLILQSQLVDITFTLNYLLPIPTNYFNTLSWIGLIENYFQTITLFKSFIRGEYSKNINPYESIRLNYYQYRKNKILEGKIILADLPDI